MFKRNLLKRTLPIMLSVAMTFQSVPITAMAAENPPAAVSTEAEEPETAAEEASAESTAEPAAEMPSGSEQSSDQGTENVMDDESGEEPAPEESADAVSDSETNDQENSGSEIEAETGAETKSETEEKTESDQIVTADAAGAEKAGEEVKDTQIKIDAEELWLDDDFILQREASDLTYTIAYSTSDNFGSVVSDVKDAAKIYVNDEYKTDAGSYLDTEWQKLDDSKAWVPMPGGRPEAVGSYRLKLALKAQEEGLWLACEEYVYFNITKRELRLSLFDEDAYRDVNEGVTAGSKIKDFTDNVLKKAALTDDEEGRTLEKGANYELKVAVFKDSEEEATKDTYFRKDVDYHFVVTVEWLDTSIRENYKVDCDERAYPIHFGDARETKVEVTLKDPATEIVEIYGKDKKTAWSIEEIENTYIDTTKTVVMVQANGDESGAKQDEELGWVVPLEKMDENDADDTIKATPSWYTKENNNGNIFTEADIDQDTQFLWNNGKDLYTMLPEKKPGEKIVDEVGEYYLVYVYAGTEGAFKKGYSEPIKVTIDPQEVILKPAADSVKDLKLNTGMKEVDINRALAQVEEEFFDADQIKVDVPFKDDDFYGVSYDMPSATQYYKPVFKLMYTETERVEGAKEGPLKDLKAADYDSNGYLKLRKSDKITYNYYIAFAGTKAVYSAAGDLVKEIPVTEAADSANRNYRILADEYTLTDAANAVLVEFKDVKTAVDVDPIIKAFTDRHAEGNIGDSIGKGLNTPARMVYDPTKGLFEEKETYKAAKVTEVNEDNSAGTLVSTSDKDLTYTWETGNLAAYETLIHDERANEQNENHEAWVAELENFTFVSGSTSVPQDAGIYRLHVAYKDSSLDSTYVPSDGYVYFLIEKQQLVFKADNQYAEEGDSVQNFTKRGYSLYEIPGNGEIPNVETETPLEWDADRLINSRYAKWYPMNKAKDVDGQDKNPVEWEESTGTFRTDFDYRAAIWFDTEPSGTIYKKDTDDPYGKDSAGRNLNWKNYTTRYWDATANDGKGAYKQHFIVEPEYAKILLGKTQVMVSVDNNPFEDRVYNGDPIASELTGVTLKDKAGAPVDMQWSESPDAEGVVKVGWYWYEGGKVVPTKEAIYGGTYQLVASFEGNDTYKAICADEEGEWEPIQGWLAITDKYGKDCTFKITPLEVAITPDLRDKAVAGEPLSSMLGDGDVKAEPVYESHPIPADDEWLFTQSAGRVDSFVKGEDSINVTKGYPILGGGSFGEAIYYEDNNSDPKYDYDLIRYGKKYNVELSEGYDELFAQYAFSYDLTFKPARFENIDRGDAKVGATNFFVENGVKKGSVSVYTKKTGDTYEIKPQEGIPFVYDKIGNNNTLLMKYDASCAVDGYSWNYSWRQIDSELRNQLSLDKNYIAVNILSPREFSTEEDPETFAKNNFVYENSIKKAGGYVIAEGLVWDDRGNESDYDARYAITVLFPVKCDADGKIVDAPKPFQITWEREYTETFTLNLENAKLEANLKLAVAPKSLAFNGVVTKMAIGEEQQLDVKITKAQLGDVIQIRYRLEDNPADILAENNKTHDEYASIDPETGRITALNIEDGKKTTSVSVEAYPVRLSADGKGYEEITGKGVKIAKTKISITEVTAPAIKKVISKDISAEVQYTKVNDGYRREIYVLPARDKKEANTFKDIVFEDYIKGMKNGQWKGTFATAPIYTYGNSEYNEDLKLCRAFIPQSSDSLEIGSAYAVYVRNVSAARTLADGSKVRESHAGSVKVFETTKSVVQKLEPYFDVTEEKTKTNPVRYYNGKDADEDYIVDLADKSAQLLVNGIFLEKPSNPAADAKDQITRKLPLKTNEDYAAKLKDVYLEPKLSYYITDNESPRFDKSGKLLNPSKYATISNSGKITLKGVGKDGDESVTLWVIPDKEKNESWSREKAGRCKLVISAKPDSVTAKKVKSMKVGDGIRLADYLEYKQGKTKVPNYWSSNIVIKNKDDVEEQGFEIYQAKYDGDTHASVDGTLREGEYIITAVKPDVKECTLIFTDVLWNTDEEGKVTRFTSEEQELKLSTSALDPVKSLKAVYTDDKHITLNFAHAGHPEAFDIEVTDARGSVIFKKLIDSDATIVSIDEVEGNNGWEPQPWLLNEQKGIVADDYHHHEGNVLRYYEKTKTYAYTIYTEKLMRLSSYTISVDAVYNGVSAAGTKKPASTKAKTTNIPASYGNADIVDPKTNYPESGSAEKFTVVYGSLGSNSDFTTYLTSGNTYTVGFENENDLARTRGTDTLTWKSSNTKVLSVKANQGSYTATVKAMQQGKATITVTSKVTKKTIGRYYVAVKAVGNGSSYGGDFEWSAGGHTTFYDTFIKTNDPYYEGRVEVLTVSNPVTVEWKDSPSYDQTNDYTTNDYTWVQFTAPGYGEYNFSGTGTRYEFTYYSGDKSKVKGTITGGYNSWNKRYEYALNSLRLEEGQKIYFKVPGTFTLRVDSYTDFTKLTTDRPFVAQKDTWVSFTAPEDNYYTFKNDSGIYYNRFEQNGNLINIYDYTYNYDDDSVSIGMKAGETLFIKVLKGESFYVTKRVYNENALANGDNTLTFTKNDELEEQYQYAKFTPDVAGDYKFTHVEQDGVTVQLLAVDSNYEYALDGDAILATPYAGDDTGESTETTQNTEEWNLFIEQNQTVVVKVTVAKSAFGNAGSVGVIINVANKDVLPLVDGAEVTKDTSQTFEYTIPGDDKTETKYTITAGDAALSWCKAIGGERFKSISKLTFTVKDGKVITSNPESLKAGEKIYIKVNATGLSENVKVSIAKKSANAPFDLDSPSVSVRLKDDFTDQYTFVARKTGYYEFTATSLGEQPKHNIRVTCDDPYIVLNSVTKTAVKKLEPGNYTFEIGVEEPSNSTDETDATLSVKEIEANELKVGENRITLGKGEVKYYFFKADVKGAYNVQWLRDTGADNGDADAYYTLDTDMVAGDYDSFTSVRDSRFNYIKVMQKGDNPVSGNLQIDVRNKKYDILTSGTTVPFEIKSGEGEKSFTFTTPAKSELGYTIIVENTSTVDESKGQTVPEIQLVTVDDEYEGYIPEFGKGKRSVDAPYWNDPYEKKTITIFTEDEQEGVNVTGTITVRPTTITGVVTTGEISTKLLEGDSKWYSISIPENGRYSVSTKVGEGQSDDYDVWWYEKTSDGVEDYDFGDAEYLKKDKEFYINVKAGGSIKAEGIDVTVTLAKIQPGTITLGENGKGTVELTDATPEFYTFTAPATANYSVTHGTARLFEPLNNSEKWVNGSELKEGQTILISVGHSGTLIVEKSNMLTTAGPASATLAANESASFVFKPYTEGYYDFTVSEAEKLSVSAGSGYSNIYRGDIQGYRVINVSKKPDATSQYAFTVTNTTADPVTFTVTTKVVTPVELKLDTDFSLEKGRLHVFEFAVPETYHYTFTYSEGSKVTGENGTIDGSGEFLSKSTGDNKTTIFAEYTGTEAAGTVKVSKLVPTPVTADETTVALKVGEVKWYAYTANATGTFTVNSDVDSVLYKSLTSNSNSNSNTIANGSVVKAGSVTYIRVVNNTVADVETAKLTVKLDAMDELKLGENEVSNESGRKYMTFKAPADGFYKFESTVENGTLWYCGGVYGGSIYQVSAENQYYVANGDVVFFYVSGNNGKITVTTGDTIPASTGLTMDVIKEQELGDRSENWYTFTAKESGTYWIYADMKISMNLSVYQSGSLDKIYAGQGSDRTYSIVLNAGEKIYLKVSADSAGKYTIGVGPH